MEVPAVESLQTSADKPRPRRRRSKTKKIKHIPSEETLESEIQLYNLFSPICATVLLALLVAILIYCVQRTEYGVDIEAIQNELRNHVFYQTEAMTIVNSSLIQFHTHEQHLNILALIGPAGVGKTLTTNIIKKHFNSGTYELRRPLLAMELEDIFLNKLKSSYSDFNLVLIDDLSVNDVEDLLLLVENIPQDLNVLLVCVFNIQETDGDLNHSIHYEYVNTIQGKFVKAEVSVNFALFREFSTNQASSWVINQLKMKGVNPDFHFEITKSLLDEQDVKYQGLKGLSSKINLRL